MHNFLMCFVWFDLGFTVGCAWMGWLFRTEITP